MKPLAAILALCLASCGTIPRAIIPPPSVVAQLEVKPVVDAGRATRDAVREVSKSVDQNVAKADRVADETKRVKEAITKAREGAKEEMEAAIAQADALLDELLTKVSDLQQSLKATATARDKAVQTVDTLESETATLKANAAAQAVQIKHAAASENTLREQVSALSASADRRVIAEDKLKFWRKAAWITWGILTAYLVAKFFGTAILTYARSHIP